MNKYGIGISVFIFSYGREQMLRRMLDELDEYDPVIIDDGSSFELDHPGFVKLKHGGKQGFWKNWNEALAIYRKSKNELALFLQDDLTGIQMDKIMAYHEKFKDNPYVFNAYTDNRQWCWNTTRPRPFDDDTDLVGFVDCIFFANRSVFNKIGYSLIPVDKSRFAMRNISSGVGEQFTKRINKAKIPIYRCKTSLVHHGDHASLMHPQERIKNPLTTIHESPRD